MAWSLIIALLLGFVVGKWKRIPKGFFKYTEYVIMIGVVILLFAMGIEIGLNKNVIKELPVLGWEAFLIAFFAVLFSVVILHFFVRRFISPTRKEEEAYDVDTNS